MLELEEERRELVEKIEEYFERKQYPQLRDLLLPLEAADIAAILLPLMFRFGTERARMMIFITVGLLAALLLLSGNGLSDALGSMQALARCAVLAAALAVLPLSFLLSLRIYRRKAL